MAAMQFLQGYPASDLDGVTREEVVGIAAGFQREKDLVEQVFTAVNKATTMVLKRSSGNPPGST